MIDEKSQHNERVDFDQMIDALGSAQEALRSLHLRLKRHNDERIQFETKINNLTRGKVDDSATRETLQQHGISDDLIERFFKERKESDQLSGQYIALIETIIDLIERLERATPPSDVLSMLPPLGESKEMYKRSLQSWKDYVETAKAFRSYGSGEKA